MKQIKFKCTLLTDVILNVKSATEGSNSTLDFIPGSCFLGIVASSLYNKGDDSGRLSLEDSLKVFHSSKVRFSDAHLLVGDMRSCKVPAGMFYPKLKKPSEECYIHHEITDFDELKEKQLKQCRSGFYAFGEDRGVKAPSECTFSIKSAYDRDQRRSKDAQMFGYQAICEGAEFGFCVEFDDCDDSLIENVRDALVGIRRIGRSRSAQYGQVKIESCEYKEVREQAPQTKMRPNIYTVYADGRLIFLDEDNLPTFRPSCRDLGFDDDARILWDKSQIRTFQYSPWNFKRQSYDTDRMGIEKGSVIVVESETGPRKENYIGYYRNEGFGKVFYDPEFLESVPGENGKARFVLLDKLPSDNKEADDNEARIYSGSDPLLLFLESKRKQSLDEDYIYELVNEFVNSNKSIFRGEAFASQWGTIRKIAQTCNSDDELYKKVFYDPVVEDKKVSNRAYLGHGVAENKWQKMSRAYVLREFYNKTKERGVARAAMVNLAAEMAKSSVNES